MTGNLIIAGFLVAFSLVANRLSGTVPTVPMVVLGFGVLMAQLNILPEKSSTEALHVIAEVALIVLLFLDAARIGQLALVATAPPEGWILFGIKQVSLGPLVGVAIGWAGAVVLFRAQAANTTSDTDEGLGALALAASACMAAIRFRGNRFISAFAAGPGFGAVVPGRCKFVFELTDTARTTGKPQ